MSEINETRGSAHGVVNAFSITKADRRTHSSEVKSLASGPGPCHLVVDHTGRFVLVANYIGGSACASCRFEKMDVLAKRPTLFSTRDPA